MQWSSSTHSIVDYTTVPVGLHIEGLIWTGQATTVTAICPKCGRIGVVSIIQDINESQFIAAASMAIGSWASTTANS
jgi:hypothetical protein